MINMDLNLLLNIHTMYNLLTLSPILDGIGLSVL